MDAFTGEIRLFAGTFAPMGWTTCEGQLLAISENDTLFALIGTTYGGDGTTTFALPDLRGRVPVHQGQGPGLSNYTVGQSGGAETVTLTTQTLPSHSHALLASSAGGSSNNPQGNLLADGPAAAHIEASPNASLAPPSVTAAGGSQPHENRMPYGTVMYIICLYGLFPSRS
jgi:microcystin-dependent protein